MAVLGKLWDYWEARCAEIDMSWMILKDVVFFLWKVLIHLAFASDTKRKGMFQWMCPIFTEMIQVVQLMCVFSRIPVTGNVALLYCMANPTWRSGRMRFITAGLIGVVNFLMVSVDTQLASWPSRGEVWWLMVWMPIQIIDIWIRWKKPFWRHEHLRGPLIWLKMLTINLALTWCCCKHPSDHRPKRVRRRWKPSLFFHLKLMALEVSWKFDSMQQAMDYNGVARFWLVLWTCTKRVIHHDQYTFTQDTSSTSSTGSTSSTTSTSRPSGTRLM